MPAAVYAAMMAVNGWLPQAPPPDVAHLYRLKRRGFRNATVQVWQRA